MWDGLQAVLPFAKQKTAERKGLGLVAVSIFSLFKTSFTPKVSPLELEMGTLQDVLAMGTSPNRRRGIAASA